MQNLYCFRCILHSFIYSHCYVFLFLFQEILADPAIIKVGTVPDMDANHLRSDYDVYVQSTLDLRFLAREARCVPNGLTTMSENLIGISLDRSWNLRSSDWNAWTLTPEQIDFASEKTKAVMKLFEYFAEQIQSERQFRHKNQQLKYIIENHCRKYLNRKFV